MLNVFEHLLSSEALVDVTLACEGLSIKAHKMVLSACSPFFQSLFLENPCKHPIVILKDMRYTDLKAIIDFMYRGEVNVSQNQLSALLKTAETLKVKGLAEVSGEDGQPNGSGIVQQEVIQQTVTQSSTSGNSSAAQVTTTPSGNRAETPPLSRRKRGRPRRRSLSDSNRSDSEDQVPAKIRDRDRDADSPEIIEDRDMDTNSSTAGVIEGSNGVQRLTLPSSTQVQPQTQQESRLTIDEVVSGDETDFVEPSKLMEQTMTTENVPVFPDAQSTGSSMSPASNQRLILTNTTSLADRSLPSSSDSQAQVPVSLSSEIVVAGHSSQDIPEDIKPTGLVSFEEPPISPVAGPSHHSQDSSSAMMMYMDSSGVPAIPGPSNYQPDKQSSSQQQSQPTQVTLVQISSLQADSTSIQLPREVPEDHVYYLALPEEKEEEEEEDDATITEETDVVDQSKDMTVITRNVSSLNETDLGDAETSFISEPTSPISTETVMTRRIQLISRGVEFFESEPNTPGEESMISEHNLTAGDIDDTGSAIIASSSTATIVKIQKEGTIMERRGRGRPPLTDPKSKGKNKVYPCEECCLNYTDYSNYRRHYRKKHRVHYESIFICPVCKLSYLTLEPLLTHVEKKHNRHVFVCQICAFTSLDEGTIDEHEAAEHGSEPSIQM